MTTDALIRIVSLCVVLAGAETLHGIARTVWVIPRIGKDRAIRWSALTGSVLALGICWWLVPPIGLSGAVQHLGLGLLLTAFMAGFDIAIGMLLMRKPWRKVAPDFDPRTGNYLLFGLLFLALAPWIVWTLRATA